MALMEKVGSFLFMQAFSVVCGNETILFIWITFHMKGLLVFVFQSQRITAFF